MCGVRENSGTKTQKRMTPLIFAVMPLLCAVFFIWLNPVGLYNTLIYIIYMPMSYFLFYSKMGKGGATNYVLLPASTTEKIIAHLIQAIGIPTLMLAIMIPTMVLLQGLINLRAGQTMMSYIPVFEALTLNNFLAGLLIQAIGGFAALVFRKRGGIMPIFLSYPFFIIALLISDFRLKGMINETEILLINVVFLCLTIGVWIANYYKLKKIEI